MSRRLFSRILKGVQDNERFFVTSTDAAGRRGVSGLQKAMAALKQMTTGCSADECETYPRVSESTANVALKLFSKAIVQTFGEEYLRSPTEEDAKRLLAENEERGFPGMLGSLGCTHWLWVNCSVAFLGQYKGKEKKPTVVLEAVASQDLWIWHAYFGCPGTLNDISILKRSPIFHQLANNDSPDVEFKVNGNSYSMGYYLADGIYPDYATLINTMKAPSSPKEKLFAKRQEAVRKDVERAFGVLKNFAILQIGTRLHYMEDLSNVMLACIIMHNMIIEDERDEVKKKSRAKTPPTTKKDSEKNDIFQYIQRLNDIKDKHAHMTLRNDLVEHIWERAGEHVYL